jgi:hypothetical protein
MRHAVKSCERARGSGLGEHEVKWPGNPGEVKSAGENACVMALPAGPGSHEPVQLLSEALPLLRGLLLESAEWPELALSADDLLDHGMTESADQFVFQVGGAHVESERLHIGTGHAQAGPGPLESVPEIVFLAARGASGRCRRAG